MLIAITGGTGFLGQTIIKMYGKEYDFVVLSRKKAFESLQNNEKYITVNYENKDELKKALFDCDAVIHLGASVMHDMDSDVCLPKYIHNLTFSDNLFGVCRELGIKNIVNASSAAVYGMNVNKAYTEEDLCFPNSCYGLIKHAVEDLAYLYNQNYGMKIKSLRYGKILGYWDMTSPKSFWGILLNNCINKEPIPVWGSGKTGRDVLYVKDASYATISAILRSECKGVFNIGSGRVSSNAEIAKKYCDVFGNTAGIKHVPMESEKIVRTSLDCSKAKREIEFSVRFGLEDMIYDIKKEGVSP